MKQCGNCEYFVLEPDKVGCQKQGRNIELKNGYFESLEKRKELKRECPIDIEVDLINGSLI